MKKRQLKHQEMLSEIRACAKRILLEIVCGENEDNDGEEENENMLVFDEQTLSNEKKADNKQQSLLVRTFWLLGRISECLKQVKQAKSYFFNCSGALNDLKSGQERIVLRNLVHLSSSPASAAWYLHYQRKRCQVL